MFEDRTYDVIMKECFETAPPGIDLRQGSIFYDAVASACFKIAQFYADLRHVFDLVFLTSTVDEYLDRKGEEYQVFRNQATSAQYEYAWVGSTAPDAGERFFAEGLYFVLKKAEDQSLFLEAERPGTGGNNILSGTPAVPVSTIIGLTTSVFGALINPGTDTEENDHYRGRIKEKIGGPAENGNRQHYKTWCESAAGVQRARIIPLFAGENTVAGVLFGPDGMPAPQPVVDYVQEFIDPMSLGLTVDVWGKTVPIGDGLGDGVANIGAHFAAIAPEKVYINIELSVELKESASHSQFQEDAENAVTDYLKDLALSTSDNEDIVIRLSAISALLYALPNLLDYKSLTLNGAVNNIKLAEWQVGALGEVEIEVI